MAIRDFRSIRTLSPSSNALSSIQAARSGMILYITIVVFSLLFELIRKRIFKNNTLRRLSPPQLNLPTTKCHRKRKKMFQLNCVLIATVVLREERSATVRCVFIVGTIFINKLCQLLITNARSFRYAIFLKADSCSLIPKCAILTQLDF